MWLFFWVGFLLIGIAVLLQLYAGLLNDLRKYNKKEFFEMGSPVLFMISPGRGIRLQRFIYSGSKLPGINSIVRKKCALIGILTPIFVILGFVILFVTVRMEM